MNCNIRVNSQRARAGRLALLAAAVAWVATCDVVQAQTTPAGTVRVEEDWVLVVSAPAIADNSPQVTCAIAPQNIGGGYLALDVNCHTQPGYSAGGVQIHVWSPNSPMLVANADKTAMLQTDNETISWTTRMALTPGQSLTFQILNGVSTTWGDFTDNGNLSLSVATTLMDLTGYSPTVSIQNSGVSYATNRVTSLTLKAIRWYSASGTLLAQDTTAQTAYPK